MVLPGAVKRCAAAATNAKKDSCLRNKIKQLNAKTN
jgi:hypothetical protein